MKKLLIPILSISMLMSACKGGNSETTNSDNSQAPDPISENIKQVLQQLSDGLKPGMEISKVKEFDKEAKEFMLADKNTGNFESKTEKDNVSFNRFYSILNNNPSKLYEIRVNMGHTGDTDSIPALDMKKYSDMINSVLAVNYTKGTADYGTENTFYWEKDNYKLSLEASGDHDLMMNIKEKK